MRKLFFVIALAASGILSLAGCSGSTCNATNCGGCCDANGTCQPGNVDSACGKTGGVCGVCGTGMACSSGVCAPAGNCTPACSGLQCGPDGCGGSCGTCLEGQSCNSSGQCVNGSCTPQCSGKQCGSDGCGGSCGTCGSGQSCNASGVCVTSTGGSVTGTGGTVSNLYFAVVGDTRPGTDGDCANYPTAVATKIFQEINALNPQPQFVLTTGDYQYCSPGQNCSTGPTTENCAQAQIGYYVQAAANYTGGPIFSSMGNHECNGFTTSNITFSGGSYSTGLCNGVNSENYNQWFAHMVAPLGQTKPYYSVPINATDGSWTAKFVNVACNAWDSTQQSWLQGVLAQSTTYTFVFRHEDPGATTGPCVTQVDSMLSSAQYTMLIFGHSHSYQATPPKNLLVGNGGAGSGPFGFATVQQQPGGHFLVTQYSESTGAAVGTATY